MKKIYYLFFIFLIASYSVSCEKESDQTDPLYQVNSFALFATGQYEGFYPYSSILSKGDFGIGTFDALNGEMVLLDGKLFRIEAAGNPVPVDGSETAPVASFCRFQADLSFESSGGSLDELKAEIDAHLSNKELFYGIRIEGIFNQLTTRSIYAQELPYRPLTEVVKEEVRLESQNLEGTAVGFWAPQHMEQSLWKAYHLHFLSKDETVGGHIHEAQLGPVVVKIDVLNELNLILNN